MKHIKLLLLLIVMALGLPQSARAEYYGIKVAGVSVTSDNCENITGENIKRCFGQNSDYWVRYEPSTKTLTLHNIRIERKGSGNRAILNESCDGLTIVLEGEFDIFARDASPIRLNANTTITHARGIYSNYLDDYHRIYSWYSDAITISNGAQLVLSDIQLKVSSSDDACFLGNTGKEKVILVDAFVKASSTLGYGMKNISKLGVQNSSLLIESKNGVSNLKEFVLVGKERMNVLVPDHQHEGSYGQITTRPVYYSETEQTFLSSEDNSKAGNVAILPYIPIDEETFPDEAFRNYVSKEYDNNSNGELDFTEILKVIDLNSNSESISSMKGIEHLRFLETIDCRFNKLTQLDIRNNACLKRLDCGNNQITMIRLSEHPYLTKIDCYNNLLTYIDFSGCPKVNDIDISGNRIDGWMTDVLESLPDATGSSETHQITIGNNGPNDNVCTKEQADIAKNKGWDVIIDGLDSEGNIVYGVTIAGKGITSANAGDLTVLPGVTKNNTDGSASYNPTTNTLYLNGVDIVNQSGNGISINLTNTDFTIILGQEPVNITSSFIGIYAAVKTLNVTTETDWWYKEKLTITSSEKAFDIIGDVVLDGVTHIEAVSTATNAIGITHKLYVRNDAELRIKACQGQNPFKDLQNIVLENDNIFVTPAGAYYDTQSKKLRNAEGKIVSGQEVVIGKLREYNYYVAGTRISNANLHDVLGDGTVVFQEPSYSDGAGTLTLKDANIETDSAAGIEASKTLFIKLVGDNTINSTTYGIRFTGAYNSTYIDGPGSLYVKGQYGIDCNKLYITDAQVTAEGTTRYAINGPETTISGKNTIVKMKCEPDARGTFRALTSLTLNDGLKIVTPEGAQYVHGEIKDADGNVIKDEWVTIMKDESYNLYIAGKQVTDRNKDDVLGDGTISYDSETKTLTLNGANIETETVEGIASTGVEINIALEGENNITCGRNGLYVMDARIEGSGSLNVKSEHYAIRATSSLRISNGAQVTAEGISSSSYAIVTTFMSVDGAETIVNMKGTMGTYSGFAPELNDGLVIGLPIGAHYSTDTGFIVNAADEAIKDEWVIIASQDFIDGIDSIPAEETVNGNWQNSKCFNLAGQQVGADFKGIVIENGRKMLKK